MFRGRKVGTVRRFGKTIFIVCCALALVYLGRASRDVAADVSPAGAPAKAKTPIAVSPADFLPKGRRAYSIVIDNANGILSSITDGSRVDINAAFPAGPDGLPVAMAVLRNVPVIGVKPVSGGTALILAVSPDDAVRAAFAVANARVSVSLCPGGPDTAEAAAGVTFDDL